MYKSEAYEKFQNLLYRLKFDVTAYIAGIDFALLQQQQTPQTITVNSQSEAEYLKMLQQVSSEVKVVQSLKKQSSQTTDGVEIFEVSDTPQSVTEPDMASHKTRPNDSCPCGSGKKYKKCC